MCFFNSGGGSNSATLVDTTVPAPTPPPQAPAAPPSSNKDKSGESQDSANPTANGYGSLIIPRTALQPVSRATPVG